MDNKQIIIDISGLSYSYENENVLEDINLSITRGSFLGIVGPNGSGKSTLLKLILGLIKKQRGDIQLFGKDISHFRDWGKIGFVSQKANSFNTGFPATVYEVVKSGLTKKIGLLHYMKKEHHVQILKAIDSVGLLQLQKRNIGELSGGQQQRVFIARALVSEPELLILDEPTVGVDAENVRSFYGMLSDLNQKLGITLLLVTHDIGSITDKVTHVVCLNKYLYFHGDTEVFEEQKKNGMPEAYGFDLQMLSHKHDHEKGREVGGDFQ